MITSNTLKPSVVEFIGESLERSKKSLKMMVRQEIGLKVESIQPLRYEEQIFLNEQKNDVVVTTEIIGDMKGKSYFFMDKETAVEFHDILMKRMRKTDISEKAILKEIDNIISASAISVIANHMKNDIYGDVPHYFEQDNDQICEVMKNDFRNLEGEELVIVKADFEREGKEGVIGFYWIIAGLSNY
ncbi:MAG: hypothetical protein OEX02_06385 [Cyclobacteriaceae bacterium]|nr:hypothetical protein [Cyclobacteriaceae bacterium]